MKAETLVIIIVFSFILVTRRNAGRISEKICSLTLKELKDTACNGKFVLLTTYLEVFF